MSVYCYEGSRWFSQPSAEGQDVVFVNVHQLNESDLGYVFICLLIHLCQFIIR